MPHRKLWDQVLDKLQGDLIPDELRRWFGESMQAGDTGDQVTIWVPSEPVRRHILTHYQDLIDRALEDLGRQNIDIRFVAPGVADDGDEDVP